MKWAVGRPRAEMPRNRAFSCAFPPRSGARFVVAGTARKRRDKVDKSEVFSGGYEGRAESRVDLGERYRRIGISAVAAAVRYQGEARNAAYARNDSQGETEPAS